MPAAPLQIDIDADVTTQAHDVTLLALNHWMCDFLAIARIALADQPQRLVWLFRAVDALSTLDTMRLTVTSFNVFR